MRTPRFIGTVFAYFRAAIKEGVCTMNTEYRHSTTTLEKWKKQKKAAKPVSSARIAQQYMELRRLRERISEVEAWRANR